jgi:NAD(P)-dependent dehydrogenase (short-subunit alcohol dehydrogenase family)
MMSLAGKRVLITGGTRGIGLATARAFLEAEACVALNGRNASSVDEAMSQLSGQGRIVSAPGNVASVDECRSIVTVAIAGLGGLDVLVNNAGIGGPGKAIEDVSEAEWNDTVNVNLRGVYFCTKFAVPALRQSKGNVVNIASVDGVIGSGRNDSIYCTTKGGVVNMTRDLAIELAPDIRVNCICPGPIDTDMLQEFGRFLGDGDIEAGYVKLRAAVPMKRIARPEELASVVIYLASDMAGFVTGTTNIVDGGVTAKMVLPNSPR